MSSAADGGGREDSGEEADAAQDPDLAAMWQRFQHLTDKLSASNERSESLKTMDGRIGQTRQRTFILNLIDASSRHYDVVVVGRHQPTRTVCRRQQQ